LATGEINFGRGPGSIGKNQMCYYLNRTFILAQEKFMPRRRRRKFPSPNRAQDRLPTTKATGLTPSERYLETLCANSFLSLWSYPALFRKQKAHASGDGKELCDLLVVFGDHVLIFSDKNCAFPNSGDVEIDWRRWHKKAILNSAAQAWGAERWLKEYPQEIFLDRACMKPFPLKIPSPETAKYHLIVVANGSEECSKKLLGGSGTLMLSSAMTNIPDRVFMVRDLDPNRTFVHVLSETALSNLVTTLDTISDFTNYLGKKEILFRSTNIAAAGEEELLAIYLDNYAEGIEHAFPFSSEDPNKMTVIQEGFWEDFRQSARRSRQLEENRVSYVWDGLIERFSQNILNATQYYSSHVELSEIEKGLRLMAAETRTRRRAIMMGIVEMFTSTPDDSRRVKVLAPSSPGEPYYVFLCLPKPSFVKSNRRYRFLRGQLLEAYLMVVKYLFSDALDIVGVASEPASSKPASEDLIYLDARHWSSELHIQAEEFHKKEGLLSSLKVSRTREWEFPPP
jgi:hypothetical protein